MCNPIFAVLIVVTFFVNVSSERLHLASGPEPTLNVMPLTLSEISKLTDSQCEQILKDYKTICEQSETSDEYVAALNQVQLLFHQALKFEVISSVFSFMWNAIEHVKTNADCSAFLNMLMQFWIIAVEFTDEKDKINLVELHLYLIQKNDSSKIFVDAVSQVSSIIKEMGYTDDITRIINEIVFMLHKSRWNKDYRKAALTNKMINANTNDTPIWLANSISIIVEHTFHYECFEEVLKVLQLIKELTKSNEHHQSVLIRAYVSLISIHVPHSFYITVLKKILPIVQSIDDSYNINRVILAVIKILPFASQSEDYETILEILTSIRVKLNPSLDDKTNVVSLSNQYSFKVQCYEAMLNLLEMKEITEYHQSDTDVLTGAYVSLVSEGVSSEIYAIVINKVSLLVTKSPSNTHNVNLGIKLMSKMLTFAKDNEKYEVFLQALNSILTQSETLPAPTVETLNAIRTAFLSQTECLHINTSVEKNLPHENTAQ